jgi:hypothetical protein
MTIAPPAIGLDMPGEPPETHEPEQDWRAGPPADDVTPA